MSGDLPTRAPVFSIVMPTYDTPSKLLRLAMTSVLAQTFRDWELIVVDDASPIRETVEIAAEFAAYDPRVVVQALHENQGISGSTNAGIERATGDFVVLFDHDDLLAPTALQSVFDAITPSIDYVYTDEDKIDDEGRHYDAFHKPHWSPARLLGQMYTSHLSVVRRSLIAEIGGFRSDVDGSQDHDLVLRVTERARGIVHVPQVLYHWRATAGSTALNPSAKDFAWEAGRRAVQDALDRRSIAGVAALGPIPGTYRIDRQARAQDVDVIVVARPRPGSDGTVGVVERIAATVRGFAPSANSRLSFTVVHEGPGGAELDGMIDDLSGEGITIRPVEAPPETPFADLLQLGVDATTCDTIVCVQDGVVPLEADVVDRLVAPLDEEDVGMTGPCIVIDGHLSLTGQRFGHDRVDGPEGAFHPVTDVLFRAPVIDREVSTLPGTCLAIERRVLDLAGGFGQGLDDRSAPADLALKLTQLERRILWVRWAEVGVEDQPAADVERDARADAALLERWYELPTERYLPSVD